MESLQLSDLQRSEGVKSLVDHEVHLRVSELEAGNIVCFLGELILQELPS
jgi:hypothetical protein